MVRLLPLALGATLVGLSSAGAWAATPSAELRAFFADATLILTDPETEGKYAERLFAIRAITRQIFDFREAARLALGPVWTERTNAEQDEFVRLYGDLLERAFIAWIAARAQIAGGPRVSFIGEVVDGDHATVRTTVLARTGQELSLDYRMIERGDRWAVRDVVIDGVSLAANYRAQFARVIQGSSYLGLVRQLQERASAPPPVAIASADRGPDEPAVAPPAPTRDAAQPSVAPLPRRVAVIAPDAKAVDLTTRTGQVPARPDAAPSGSAGPVRDPRSDREVRFEPVAIRLTAVTPTRPVGKVASSPKTYWVQVAAFKSRQAAIRLVALLRGEKAPASDPSSKPWPVVMEPGPDLARVRVGPFADRTEAASSLRKLEARGFKPFIAEDRERSR